MESSVGFYYNNDIIEDAGIEVPSINNPWTWSEFIEICKELKEHLEDGYVIDMPFPSGENNYQILKTMDYLSNYMIN